ncbi:MAG: OmpA family protein [Pseudomonadota bacterium]
MKHSALIPLLALAPLPALAVDRSLDTQLVQPALLPGAVLGVDSARVPEGRAILGGGAWQLEHLPLEYFENTLPAGAAIQARNTLHLAAGYPLGGRVVLGGRWSAALMDAGDEPTVAPEHRVAAGDLGLFAKLGMLGGERAALGARLDLWLPTGTAESWVSEASVRYSPCLLGQLDLAFLQLQGQVGATLRDDLDTDRDFTLGSELTLALGALVPIGERWGALAEVGSRHGFNDFMKPGAENPVELQLGGRWLAPQQLAVQLAAGTALSNGYGAADFRMLVSVARLVPAPRVKAPPDREVVDVPPPREARVAVIDDLPDEKAPVKWQEGQLAQVRRGRIEIREPLQFELDTARLLPASEPVLEAVAEVMTQYAQIELLIIEGHASEEGSFRYNYDLSNARAASVYEALVGAGVRPERLSYRGLGEVAPVKAGEDEASLAINRRVSFHIVKVRDYLDVAPDYGGAMITLPWSGERIPEPPPGQKLLSADANPVILEEYADRPSPAEDVPDAASFRPGLGEDEDGGEEEAP